MCINNSYILYKQNPENNKKIDFLNYRLNLIKQILQKYSQKSNIWMENIKNNNNVDKTMKLKIIKNYIHYPKQIKGLKKNCYYYYKKTDKFLLWKMW